MNRVELIGRLTRDVDIRYTTSNKAVASFTLAVNRRNADEADFISCVAWDKTAELLEKYVRKGHKIGIVGRIQTGSYNKQDGTKAYTTDVIVDELEFLEKKADSAPEHEDEGFAPIEQSIEQELPFK